MEKSDKSYAILRNKPFALFWLARMASGFAYQILAVAVGWHVYSLTGSAFYLGLVGLAQFLPMFFLTLIVGHVADRYDRRQVLRICQTLQGFGVLTLAVATSAGLLNENGLLVVAFVLGATRAFETPTGQALMPNLVEYDVLPKAIAWSTSTAQTTFIAGPALGGFLYVVGPGACYSVVCGLFFVAGILVGFVSEKPRQSPSGEHRGLSSLFAGIGFIRGKKAVLGAISLDLFAVLLGGATALLPIFAREILSTGPWGLGLLRAAPAVGAFLVSLSLARFPVRRHVGRRMFIAVIVFGIATVIFGLSTSFLLSIGALMILGGADVISVVIRQSLVQIQTPDGMRGRVSAVNAMFIGTSNQLGEFESGTTAAWFGVVPAVIIGGVGTVVIALLWMYLFPELRRIKTVTG
jgi:MFS family permease